MNAPDRRHPQPATRADHIISSGNGQRRLYAQLNPGADSAMIFGAQIGYLHGEIRRLDAELQAFAPARDKNLAYATLYCDELDCDVLVGYDYSEGEDSQTSGPPERCYEGSPEELSICEVWVNGADVLAALSERVIERLTDAALDAVHEEQESARADGEQERWVA